MPRFAANLCLMHAEHPFLQRFGTAAADGFGSVEFLFPYAHTPAEPAAALQAAGQQLVPFNLPPG